MCEHEPKSLLGIVPSKRVIVEAIAASAVTIFAPELLGIPQEATVIVGFGGTMIISAAAQSAATAKNLLRKNKAAPKL